MPAVASELEQAVNFILLSDAVSEEEKAHLLDVLEERAGSEEFLKLAEDLLRRSVDRADEDLRDLDQRMDRARGIISEEQARVKPQEDEQVALAATSMQGILDDFTAESNTLVRTMATNLEKGHKAVDDSSIEALRAMLKGKA